MRRTMISLRGFQPPRSSADTRAAPNTCPSSSSAVAVAEPTTGPSNGSAPSSQRSGRNSTGKGKKKSPGVSTSKKQPQQNQGTEQGRRSLLSSLAGTGARLGGHFSANRKLMGQVKVTRRYDGDAPYGEEDYASPYQLNRETKTAVHHRLSHPNSQGSTIAPSQSSISPEKTFLEMMLDAAAAAERSPLDEREEVEHKGSSSDGSGGGSSPVGAGGVAAHEAPPYLSPPLPLSTLFGMKRTRSSRSSDNDAREREEKEAITHGEMGRLDCRRALQFNGLLSQSSSSLSPTSGALPVSSSAASTAALQHHLHGDSSSSGASHTTAATTTTSTDLSSSLFLRAFQQQPQQQQHVSQEPARGPGSVMGGSITGSGGCSPVATSVPVSSAVTEERSAEGGHCLGPPPSLPSIALQPHSLTEETHSRRQRGHEQQTSQQEQQQQQSLFDEEPLQKKTVTGGEEEEEEEGGESAQALAREVEEDLRLSEDLPFTPHRGYTGADVPGGSAPSSQLHHPAGPPSLPQSQRLQQLQQQLSQLEEEEDEAARRRGAHRRHHHCEPALVGELESEEPCGNSNSHSVPPCGCWDSAPPPSAELSPAYALLPPVLGSTADVPAGGGGGGKKNRTVFRFTAATSASASPATPLPQQQAQQGLHVHAAGPLVGGGQPLTDSLPPTTAVEARPEEETALAGGVQGIFPPDAAASAQTADIEIAKTMADAMDAPFLPEEGEPVDLSQVPPPASLQLFAPQPAVGEVRQTRTCFSFSIGVAAAPAPALSCVAVDKEDSSPHTAQTKATSIATAAAASRGVDPAQPPLSPPMLLEEPSPILLPPPSPLPVAEPESQSWYDLPPMVQLLFSTRRGVKQLYAWQHNLLSRPDIRGGGNFVYSMPTSGGKTLVAELSLLRCVLNRRQSAFLVVPFVSLAEEKTMALRPFGEVLDFAVEGHYGSTGRFPLPPAPALFVCTIEKANSLLNHLLGEGRGDELGAVVVDELHMLGEPRRGATLELFLSKLMMLSDRQRTLGNTFFGGSSGDRNRNGTVQIIGMSATIPNLAAIAEWLRAAIYEGTDRPVPLRQYSVVDGLVLRDGEANERNLNGKTEVDHLFELAFEAPEASVLIFCASRQQCVDTAKGLVLYAKRMATVNSPGLALTTALEQFRVAHPQQQGPVIEEEKGEGQQQHTAGSGGAVAGVLRPNTSAGVRALVDDLQGLAAHSEATALTDLVQFGVAFHHGGLLAEEREAVEGAYRSRLIRILCCTSTLAAGVNLPARRVIFKTPYIGREFLTKSRYLQMCGRAGRAGLDTYGESFLILARRDRDRGHRLMRQGIEPCLSQMLEEAGNLPRSLLECVTVGLVGSQAAAMQAWCGHLLASTALGPVDATFAGPLHAQLGQPSAAADDDEGERQTNENRDKTTEGGTAGVALGEDSSSAITNASARPATVETPESLLPLPLAQVQQQQSVQQTTAAVAVGGGSSSPSSFPPSPSRPVAYVAHIQAHHSPRAILSALLADSLAVLMDSGLATTAPSSTAENPLQKNLNLNKKDGSVEGNEEVASDEAVLVRPTPFGASAVRSCFSVEEALLVRAELENLRSTGLILGDDLHLCYFLTPLREVGDCDWRTYTYLYAQLSDSQQRIADLLGVSERFITMRAMGLGGGRGDHDVPRTAEGKRDFFTARRFYVALMLADVLTEVPMDEVEARYNVRRGQLQSLMRSASMFSSSITSFCHAMEWFSLEAVLASFVKRLGFGVKPDLVPLMEIRNVQPGRARALWNAGYKTPKLIAACEDPDEMVRKVKSSSAADSKTAKFFSRRSAIALIREANLLLEYQIREKKEELHLLTGGKS